LKTPYFGVKCVHKVVPLSKFRNLVGDWLLVVWKLDRLGLSLSHLVEFINNFKNKEIGFKSL